MAKQFSLNNFIHSIDEHDLFEEYFQIIGLSGFNLTKFNKEISKRQVKKSVEEEIITFINLQSEKTRQEIEIDFSNINKMSGEGGVQSLLDEAKDQSISIPLEVETQKKGTSVSFWFFNKHKNVFNGANVVQDFLTSGWKRVPVPNKPISIVLENKNALEEGLKKYFQSKDKGIGKSCLVEVYPKKDRVYVVAYVSARGVNDVIPDEKNSEKLIKATRRDYKEIYFVYLIGNDGDEGELEIKAQGGYYTQKDLLTVFADTILKHRIDDTKQKYDLELLKNKDFSLVYDTEDEVEGWWLKGVDLKTPDLGTKIKLNVKGESRNGMEAMWLELEKLNLSQKFSVLRLDGVDMKIKFKPTPKHPRGTKTFHISWKDTSTLNDIEDLDIKVAKVLKKSKIDCGFTN